MKRICLVLLLSVIAMSGCATTNKTPDALAPTNKVSSEKVYTASLTKTLSFVWTYLAEWEAEITGFEIYQVVGVLPEKVVISNIPKTARFATGPITYDNGTVNRFYIRALNNSDPLNIERSDPSNTVRILAAPGQFKRD